VTGNTGALYEFLPTKWVDKFRNDLAKADS
jgi:hypothetical protein